MTLACPICGTAIAPCCAATVAASLTQRDRNGAASEPQVSRNGTATTSQSDRKGTAKANARNSSSRSKAQEPYTQDFLAFWSAYPRKKDRGYAFRAWQTAIKAGAEPQVLIAGAAKYASDPQRDPHFTKLPATWINARAWEDEEDEPARVSDVAGWNRKLGAS